MSVGLGLQRAGRHSADGDESVSGRLRRGRWAFRQRGNGAWSIPAGGREGVSELLKRAPERPSATPGNRVDSKGRLLVFESQAPWVASVTLGKYFFSLSQCFHL